MSAALGPYASFIVLSYALAALVVVALTLWVALDFRRQTQALRDLEASGITRRSARQPGDKS
jgi:heme exporter protein D